MSSSKGKLIVCIHGVSSVQRLVDTARLVFSMPFNVVFVVTRVSGAAAQAGIPEVNKLAIKYDKGFAVLPDIHDLIELYSPSKVILLSHQENAEPRSAEEIAALIDDNTAIVIPGSEPGFTAQEARYGTLLKMKEFAANPGPIPMLSILLFLLYRKTI